MAVIGISAVFYLIDRLSPYGKRYDSKPSWVFHVRALPSSAHAKESEADSRILMLLPLCAVVRRAAVDR